MRINSNLPFLGKYGISKKITSKNSSKATEKFQSNKNYENYSELKKIYENIKQIYESDDYKKALAQRAQNLSYTERVINKLSQNFKDDPFDI